MASEWISTEAQWLAAESQWLPGATVLAGSEWNATEAQWGTAEYQWLPAESSGSETPVQPDWAPSQIDYKSFYLFILTGAPDGLADVTIPVSYCGLRRRDGEPTYMEVTVPAGRIYAQAISERPNGEMVLYKGVQFISGNKYSKEIARVDLEDIRPDEGGRSYTIGLSGHRTVTNTEPKTVRLSGASYRTRSNDKRRYRCAVSLFLNPGDTAQVDGESFTVGYISYSIGPRGGRMEVVEA